MCDARNYLGTVATVPERDDEQRRRDARDLMVGLIQIGRSMRARLEARGEDVSEYYLLHLIDTAGSIRFTELAGAALVDHSTVSRHVARLVERDLVARIPDPADGRAVRLALTDRGRQLLAELNRRRSAVLADALDHWSERDATRLVNLVARLSDDLRATTEAPEIPRVDLPSGRPAARTKESA